VYQIISTLLQIGGIESFIERFKLWN